MAIEQHYIAGNEAVLLADAQTLENDTELYDENCIKPAPYAFARLHELLTDSARHMRSAFPSGTVYPDGSGALRVEWVRPNREVTLVVFSGREERHYIFHKEGQDYVGDYDVTPERLGCYLEWLNNDERHFDEC